MTTQAVDPTTALVPQTSRDLTVPANRAAVIEDLRSQIALIQEAMDTILVRGVHYGLIPGTKRPSLWQPGAEMLCQMFRFQTDMHRTGEHEDWDAGIFSYTYKCRLANQAGELITEREATCSSQESKYKNQPAASIRETIMQMAQKRAYVSAVKASAAASATFSMDDDIVPDTSSANEFRGGVGRDTIPEPIDEGHGICPEHKVAYFMKGKMKSPAHKVGENQWCNRRGLKEEVSAMLRERFADQNRRKEWVEEAMPGLKGVSPVNFSENDWQAIKGKLTLEVEPDVPWEKGAGT